LVAYGYDEETVVTWGREELMARYAEAVLANPKPKVELAAGDPVLEREKLALERERLEFERQKEEVRQREEKERMEFEK